MKRFIDFIKKHKYIFCTVAIMIIVLTIAFLSGGSISNGNSINTASNDEIASTSSQNLNLQENEDNTAYIYEATESTTLASTIENTTVAGTKDNTVNSNSLSSDNVSQVDENGYTSKSDSSSDNNGNSSVVHQTTPTQSETKDKYQTDAVPAGKPQPVEPQEQETKDNTLTCVISINCSTILDNMEYLKKGKEDLVPDDGWILKPTSVTFKEGESVFDILQKTCKQNKIHMEFNINPVYNSAYINGINNLYEFDCTSGSGWMYSVNDWFPNYGISRYQVQNGDTIKLIYTCDYGYDIGAEYISEEY